MIQESSYLWAWEELLTLVSLGDKPLTVQPRAWEGAGNRLRGLEKPPAPYPLIPARSQIWSCDSCWVVWAHNPLCCCTQGCSPAPRMCAGTSCNSSCAVKLQQGWGCRLGGFVLALWGLSQSIAIIGQGGCSHFQCDGEAPLPCGRLSHTVCAVPWARKWHEGSVLVEKVHCTWEVYQSGHF